MLIVLEKVITHNTQRGIELLVPKPETSSSSTAEEPEHIINHNFTSSTGAVHMKSKYYTFIRVLYRLDFVLLVEGPINKPAGSPLPHT